MQIFTAISALAKACTQRTGQHKIPQPSPTGSFELLRWLGRKRMRLPLCFEVRLKEHTWACIFMTLNT